MCEQIDEALHSLSADKPSDTQTHDARKAIKRSRATLRLLREVLSDRDYRRENETLRDAARPLSAVRDARVLIDALDDLLARGGAEDEKDSAIRFRGKLKREQADLRRSVAENGHAFERTRGLVRGSRRRVARWKVGACGWSDLADGLQKVYARARKSWRASRADRTSECLHEWRKQSKYLLYDLQLLQPLAPGRVEKLAERAHRLTDDLGDDHDLTVLEQKALANENTFQGHDGLHPLLKAIRQRQSRLRKKAFKNGAKLYAAKPARFRGRFDRYWERSRES